MRIKNNTLLHSQDARRGRAFSVLLILVFVSQAYATTWIVQPEPGGHFIHVQDAIDGANHGDTILVEPSTYYENINFNGKNVVLTSRYLFTEDETYINNTILDGDHLGRVVTIINGESRTCQLIGFTIQNGFTPPNVGGAGVVYGGGIRIQYSSPSIVFCTIRHNFTSVLGSGGGISISYDSAPLLSGLSIHSNQAGNFSGGGIGIALSANPEFDAVNKCSIYNNYAGYNNDISVGMIFTGSLSIPLDTFTIDLPDQSSNVWPDGLNLTMDHAYFEKVAHDLYVSSTGDNQNSGLISEDPLKTIQHALTIIESDSTIRRRIYIEEGVYSPSDDQFFPLNIRSNVDLIGAGQELTILDGENERNLIRAWFDNHYRISNLTIKGCAGNGEPRAVRISENIDAEYRNIRFTENNGGSILQGQVGFPEGFDPLHPLNTSVLFDSLEFIDNTCRLNTTFGGCARTEIRNSIFRNTQAVYDDIWELYLNYPFQILTTFHIENPVNIVSNVEVSLNENMQAWGPAYGIALRVSNASVKVLNSTFADNHLPESMGAGITLTGGAELVIANSIIHGNTPNQFWLENAYNMSQNTLVIKNCLIQGGGSGVGQVGENNLYWLENNLDSAPWFQGGEENPYYLTANSPAIDAGTDFFVWEGDTIINLSPDDYTGLAPDIGAYEYHEPDAIDDASLPLRFKLFGNFPNPFNSSTRISFSIPETGEVELIVFNMRGQRVEHQSFESLPAGVHQINWEARGLPSGLYLYQIESRKMKVTGKALLVR
ncbi:MAG: DUF1565 domain-containing protein [Candidatus Marinimicrobia bacterium]|nr:DUF1565 domain-containing protein [Candidatus Neomarinimicrobiota bacterium]